MKNPYVAGDTHRDDNRAGAREVAGARPKD
jgi:hypothetical protein